MNAVSFLETAVLHCGDNLEVLSEYPTECVDLIYLDPPFFSNRRYEVVWGDEAEVRSFHDRWAGGIRHYTDWMKERILEMRRVLRPTGSLYLHCDPHASHYLKVMMDDVFGMGRFQNEIVWKRTPFAGSSKARALQLPRSHDLILFYTKGDTWTWNGPTQPYSEKYLARFKWDDHDGRGPYRKTLLKTYSDETFARLKANNRLVEPTRPGAKYSYKQYLAESSGRTQVDDVWVDVNAINPVARERIGWPTQKPEALMERIIAASSNPGDIVLDPFCGCGTTVAVAERLERSWIGIDISLTAVDIMYRRILTQTNGAVEPEVKGRPMTADALRGLQPFEFQNWVMREVNGTASPRRSGDMGVDGLTYMYHEPIQVKQSERVGRPVLDEFQTAVRRSGKDIGYIIGFSFSKQAYEEVIRARDEEGLTIVLVTVTELLEAVESVTRPRAAEGRKRRTPPTPDLMRLLSGRKEAAFPPAPSPRAKPSSKSLIESVQSKETVG